MLVLPTLTKLLEVVLSQSVHTAVLATPEGRLLAYSTYTPRHKDDIRLLTCLSMEILVEMDKEEFGMATSEMGRIVVSPIRSTDGEEEDRKTRVLVLLNASESVPWSELQSKIRGVKTHLSQSVGEIEEVATAMENARAAAHTRPDRR